MAKNNTIKFEIELDPDEVSNISLKNQERTCFNDYAYGFEC